MAVEGKLVAETERQAHRVSRNTDPEKLGAFLAVLARQGREEIVLISIGSKASENAEKAVGWARQMLGEGYALEQEQEMEEVTSPEGTTIDGLRTIVRVVQRPPEREARRHA